MVDDQAGLLAEPNMLKGEISSNSQVTANVFTVTVTGVAALMGFKYRTTGLLGFACLGLGWAFIDYSTGQVIAMTIASVILGGLTLFVAAQCQRAFSGKCLTEYCESWQRVSRQEVPVASPSMPRCRSRPRGARARVRQRR